MLAWEHAYYPAMVQTTPVPDETPERTRRPRLFYGWVIVAVGFSSQFFFGLSQQAFTTYLVPLGAEFGWSRAVLAGPRSLTQSQTALLGPLNGYLVDRFGPRAMMTIGVLLLGLGMVLFGRVQTVLDYYLVNVVLGVGASFVGLLVMSTALNSWWRRRRTMAIAISTMGFALAGIIAIPVVVWIQTSFGWRAAAMGSGVAIWIIGLPTAAFLRRSPEEMGQLPDGVVSDAVEARGTGGATRGGDGRVDFTLREAAHTSAFWTINIGSGLTNLVISAVGVHLFLHLQGGVGLTSAEAVLAFTFMNTMNLLARLPGGYLGDRLPKSLLLGGGAVGTSIAMVLLATATSLGPVLVFSGLYGLTWGMRTPILNSLPGDYFGRTSYGKITGSMQASASALGVAGPVVAGLIADAQGNYRDVMLGLAVASLLAAAALFATRPPALPPRLREP